MAVATGRRIAPYLCRSLATRSFSRLKRSGGPVVFGGDRTCRGLTAGRAAYQCIDGRCL